MHMFTPESIRTLARKAATAVEGEGAGHTIYAMGAHTGRYVVGGVKCQLFPVGMPVGTLRAAMARMAGTFAAATADTFGYWEDNGTVYVDLGSTHGDLETAMRVAVARGELAIYDTREHAVISL